MTTTPQEMVDQLRAELHVAIQRWESEVLLHRHCDGKIAGLKAERDELRAELDRSSVWANHAERVALIAERDELLSLLVQVGNAARLNKSPHYTDMRIDNDILKAIAKHKQEPQP